MNLERKMNLLFFYFIKVAVPLFAGRLVITSSPTKCASR